MVRSPRKLFFVALLLLTGGTSGASDLKPVWSIDLKPLGYPQADAPSVTTTRMRFWRQYVQIESTLTTCGECAPGSTETSSPGPTLVFDTSSGRRVPLDVVAAADWDSAPEQLHGRCKPDTQIILSRWKGMTLTCGPGKTLYLEEPDTGKILLNSGHHVESATFVAPDRFLVQGNFEDKPGCAICNFHTVVLDKTGAARYKLDPYNWGYIALNRAATRFALNDNTASSVRKRIAPLLIFSENVFYEDMGRVRLFSSEDGGKLFEYRWRLRTYENRAEGRVALSDDGSVLALIAGSHLLVFRIPENSVHS